MTRKPHRHLPPEVRAALATELQALRAAYGGSLPGELVAQYARESDVSERTVWRLSGEGTEPAPPRTAFVVDDGHLAQVAVGPNRFKAWERCVAARTCDVGYEQFTRALNRQIDPAVLAGVLRGLPAMAAKQAYLLRESESRNDIWLIDHYEVPVFVRWPGYRRLVKPWQTTLLDDRHRTVMGAVWWPKAPTAAETIAAVAAAVRGFTLPDGAFLGGRPRVLLMDQGAELIGEEGTAAYLSMGIDPQPAAARAPWAKGKLEAFHGDVLDPGYAAFPGRTGGPVDTAGRQLLTTPAGEILHRDAFRQRAWTLLAGYNAAHPHGALGGDTPLDSWLSDTAEIRRLDDAIGRQHWLSEHRTVGAKGVQLHNLHYQDGRLGGEGGRLLEVRYVPDDLTFVDVALFRGGWARAVPQPLPPTMADELLRARAEQTRRVRNVLAAARQLAADAHAEARSAAPPREAPAPAPTPAAIVAPARPERRSTNTRGGGPTAQQPRQAARTGAPVAARAARTRPRRTSRTDPEDAT